MKLYAVTSYHSTKAYMVYPMFVYISEDRAKCEAVLAEELQTQSCSSFYNIVEFETDVDLNYLISQEY